MIGCTQSHGFHAAFKMELFSICRLSLFFLLFGSDLHPLSWRTGSFSLSIKHLTKLLFSCLSPVHSPLTIIYLFVYLISFFLFMWQRERENNLKQAPGSAQSLMWGSIWLSWDHDLNQNQESDAEPTEPPKSPMKSNLKVPLSKL